MKGMQPIGDILNSVLKTYRRQPEGELVQIWDRWPAIVGDVIAGHAHPEAFKGKLLLVTVTNSTWIHHLQFLKKDIIGSINETFGKPVVDDIKFRIGSL